LIDEKSGQAWHLTLWAFCLHNCREHTTLKGMIMTANPNVKTFSVKEASDLLGLSRAIVSRLCSRGLVGTRHESVEFQQHYYRLTAEDLKTLESRRDEWQNKITKKRA